MTENTNPTATSRRIHPRTLVLALGGLMVILITTLFVVYYRYTDTWLGQKLGMYIPFPVIIVNNEVIVDSQLLTENVASIRQFYESQDFSQMGIRVDFSTADGKKRLKLRERDLLNKLLEDAVIRQLAHQSGIVITEKEARADVEKRLKEYGTADKVEATLARLYGWTMHDFEEKVVLPSLYEEALTKKFEGEVTTEKSKETILAAEKELKRSGDFKAVVEKYSDGRTKGNGGDLGWFLLEDLAPELRGPVDVAKIDVPTDMIESALGYHILLVDDIKTEEGKRFYHLHQIFVRKENFPDWIIEQVRGQSVRVLLREYAFDREKGKIDFRSKEMKDFEEKLLADPNADPLFAY